MELGCGVGPITRLLLAPSLWLEADVFWKHDFERATLLDKHPFLEAPSVAPHKITAIDVDAVALDSLVSSLKQARDCEKASKVIRWCDLKVNVHLGSFTSLQNDPGEDIDVLIAAEVIEHLEECILKQFVSVVFGHLCPKIVVLTTPNFDFNRKFRQDGETGFTDPTKRTERVFRHPDHKFEWTTSEFRQWCMDICRSHHYVCDMDGVGVGLRKAKDGSLQEDTAYGEDAKYASHVAMFVRTDSSPQTSSEHDSKDTSRILFEHVFEANPKDMQADPTTIARAFDSIYTAMPFTDARVGQENGTDIYDIWMKEEMRITCAGKLQAFLPSPSTLKTADRSLVVHDGKVYLRARS